MASLPVRNRRTASEKGPSTETWKSPTRLLGIAATKWRRSGPCEPTSTRETRRRWKKMGFICSIRLNRKVRPTKLEDNNRERVGIRNRGHGCGRGPVQMVCVGYNAFCCVVGVIFVSYDKMRCWFPCLFLNLAFCYYVDRTSLMFQMPLSDNYEQREYKLKC